MGSKGAKKRKFMIMEEDWGERRGEEERIVGNEKGEQLPNYREPPQPPPLPPPPPQNHSSSPTLLEDKEQLEEREQPGCIEGAISTTIQQNTPSVGFVRGSRPSRQASIVDYTVNIFPRPSNILDCGKTKNEQRVPDNIECEGEVMFEKNCSLTIKANECERKLEQEKKETKCKENIECENLTGQGSMNCQSLKKNIVPPSMNSIEQHTDENEGNVQECEPNKKGMCVIHECAMRKMKISTKKWKDRGKGRGFGYVRVQVTKYACGHRKLKEPDNFDKVA